MIKLLLLLILTSCSSTQLSPYRTLASTSNTRTKWVDAQFEAGWCLQVDKDKITSLMPEIFLVEEYDREVYYLSRYVPIENGTDFFENLTYEQIPTDWEFYTSVKVGLKAAHSKFQRVKCPRFN